LLDSLINKYSEMRKLIIFLHFLFFQYFPVQNCFAQNSSKGGSFFLSGTILGKDSGKIVLCYTDDKKNTIIDTAVIKRNKFIFRGNITHCTYAILFTNDNFRNLGDSTNIHFLIDANNITVLFKKGYEQNAIIKGSKLQKEKEEWDKKKSELIMGTKFLRRKIDSLNKILKINNDEKIKANIVADREQMEFLYDNIKKNDLKYISLNPKSLLSGYLLSNYTFRLSNDSLTTFYNLLSSKVKESSFGNLVFDQLSILLQKERNKYQLRDIKNIYQFSLKDTSNTLIHLSMFKGKFLLLDFWASWCKPCINNIPFLKLIEEEYKSDSFQVISISFDENIKHWKNAIIKNNLSGVQLADSNGSNGLIADFFKFTSLPRYILISNNGEIINNNTARPGEPELTSLLDRFLKKTIN
jgi:thiol-disulfide isomerase/thioredoxin